MKRLLVKSSTISIFWILLLGLLGGLRSQEYCFRFTWMGPSFNNDSYMNGSSSCADIYDNCRDPMLITYDGTPPDFNYVWENHKQEASCPLTTGYVCAKWTSYYEDTAEYTMHTCSRITVDGEGTMTSGCVTSTMNNSRWTELCACTSYHGAQPCNTGSQAPVAVFGLLIVMFLVLKFVT